MMKGMANKHPRAEVIEFQTRKAKKARLYAEYCEAFAKHEDALEAKASSGELRPLREERDRAWEVYDRF